MKLTLRATPALGPIGFLFEPLMTGRVESDTRKTVDNLTELVRREQLPRAPRKGCGSSAAH
jgi:hypothetical protein